MAILMLQDASADDIGVYDKVMKQLEGAGYANPPGRLSHVAARKGDGYLVADVWESQEALDTFFHTLGPMLAQHGSTGVKPAEIYPVHNTIKGA